MCFSFIIYTWTLVVPRLVHNRTWCTFCYCVNYILVINCAYWTDKDEDTHDDIVQKDKLDLPFVKLSKVSRATENFSVSKKLGEGGYGPVYKVRKMQKKSTHMVMEERSSFSNCYSLHISDAIKWLRKWRDEFVISGHTGQQTRNCSEEAIK